MEILQYFLQLIDAIPGNIGQGIIWGIMALGVYITFRLLDFADLSVDGSFATGGAVTVVLMLSGWNVGPALVVAFAAGVTAGVVTGVIHTRLGIPPILAGILVQIALYSVNLRIMSNKANLSLPVAKYNLLVSSRYIPKAIIVSAIFVAVIIALMYWYFGTRQGSAIRATGCNQAMSRAQGINISLMKVIALAISNGIVALSGGLIAQYQGFADINMGRGAIVIGLAAVIIGEVFFNALFAKIGNFVVKLICVVLGGVIYYIVIAIVLWLKMPPNDLKLFTAIIVAIFLAVPYLRDQAKSSFAKAGMKSAAARKESK